MKKRLPAFLIVFVLIGCIIGILLQKEEDSTRVAFDNRAKLAVSDRRITDKVNRNGLFLKPEK